MDSVLDVGGRALVRWAGVTTGKLVPVVVFLLVSNFMFLDWFVWLVYDCSQT
jgi:hypothetical protein